MRQTIVLDLDYDASAAREWHARACGLSLGQRLRDVLTDAAKPTRQQIVEDFRRIRAMPPPGSRIASEDLIREDRDSR